MKAIHLVIGLMLAPSMAAESGLRAGIARVDITPTTLMRMYGYANRKCGPANGTHDRLFAKALVLETGESRLAIVTLDLGSIVAPNLQRDVASKLRIPILLLAASHTHSAPAFLPYGSSPATDAEATAYLGTARDREFSGLLKRPRSRCFRHG